MCLLGESKHSQVENEDSELRYITLKDNIPYPAPKTS